MNIAALIMGGHVRVGLEDNLFYDLERKNLATNKMFVERLVRVAGEINRPVSSLEQTRTMIEQFKF